MEKVIDTVFTVAVHTDGTFAVQLEQPKEPLEAQRVATTYDVMQTSRAIVQEIDSQILVDRILSGLVTLLTPPTDSVPDRVKEKLKERNIHPEE